MTVQEMIGQVALLLDNADMADKSGHPELVRTNLVQARLLITEQLGDSNAVDEQPEIKEEQPTKPGHCQPDAVHEKQAKQEEKQQETSEGTENNQEQAVS